MKIVKCELPTELENIELHPLFDLHIGDSLSDGLKIQATIDYIRDNPNAYCILGGDLMDTAIATSVGDTYGANLQPMQQLEVCVRLFEPIKHKVLAVVPGNHENRIYRTDGIDITAVMAAQLGLQGKYSATSSLLFIRLGSDKTEGHHRRKVAYTVYTHHGNGGGKREGGKINALADMANIVDADIYICGHTHLPAIFRTGFFRTSYGNSSVNYVDKLFVNAAASLNYGGYGEAAGFKPASKLNPVIYLSGTERKATALV